MNPERKIEVDWNLETAETYPVKVQVNSMDRVGLLADVAAKISKHEANIVSANTTTRENSTVDSTFTLSVRDTEHLRQVLAALRRVKGVLEVVRIYH